MLFSSNTNYTNQYLLLLMKFLVDMAKGANDIVQKTIF
jgi:hypothetical protein